MSAVVPDINDAGDMLVYHAVVPEPDTDKSDTQRDVDVPIVPEVITTSGPNSPEYTNITSGHDSYTFDDILPPRSQGNQTVPVFRSPSKKGKNLVGKVANALKAAITLGKASKDGSDKGKKAEEEEEVIHAFWNGGSASKKPSSGSTRVKHDQRPSARLKTATTSKRTSNKISGPPTTSSGPLDGSKRTSDASKSKNNRESDRKKKSQSKSAQAVDSNSQKSKQEAPSETNEPPSDDTDLDSAIVVVSDDNSETAENKPAERNGSSNTQDSKAESPTSENLGQPSDSTDKTDEPLAAASEETHTLKSNPTGNDTALPVMILGETPDTNTGSRLSTHGDSER